jgi:hypothetical protein
MIANCDTLITKYSTVAYVGIILGKKVYSYFDLEELKKLAPFQNGGVSAKKIAASTIEYFNFQKSSDFIDDLSIELCK